MKPLNRTIQVYQDASWRWTITYKDKETDTPIDVSTFLGEFVIRQSMRSSAALLRSTNFTFGAAEDNVVIELTASETDALPTNNRRIDDWVYELIIWNPAEPETSTVRLANGTCEVFPSASRDDNT